MSVEAKIWRRTFLSFIWPVFVLLTGVSSRKGGTLTEFIFIQEPSDLIVNRGDPAILHCRVSFAGKGTPSVSWLKDGKLLDLRGDNKKNLLRNGSLSITQVQHRNDKGFYQCKVSVASLGTIISRKAHVDISYLSRRFLIEPEDLTVYLQDSALFQCKGDGIPNPNVTWSKDHAPLLDKPNIRVYVDGVIEISPVEFTDFGLYNCLVENSERSRTSQVANLIQNADIESIRNGIAPSFVLTPIDTEVEEKKSTILFCGANGRDKLGRQPTITWLKDGRTINFGATQGRLQRTGGGNLQIFNVVESDSGTYSCRAENMEDSVDADAVLTVLVAPKFKTRPIGAVEDKKFDLMFRCDIYGIPEPDIVWTKNGEVIQPTDYIQIVDDKHLRILGLLTSDQGYYQCIGSNKLGSIQAIAQLIVADQDVNYPSTPSTSHKYRYLGAYNGEVSNLPLEPQELMAAIVSKRFVTLKWKRPDRISTSSTESLTFSVYWKEMGSERERVLNTTQTEANVQHLKPNTNYQFRVRSYNSYGPSSNFARLSVLTDKDVAVPSPAVNVRAIPQSPSSILVEWDPPRLPQGIIIKYILIYYEVGANEEIRMDVYRTTYVLKGLKAFREYSFRVIAENKNGEGMSTEEFVAQTFSDKPSEPPQNFTLETASSTSLIVRWEPPTPDAQNGVITGYKIRYKERGLNTGSSATVTTDGNRRLYALTDLDKDTEYQVRIAALTVNGTGPYTPKLRATTYKDDLDETEVPPPPRVVRVTPYSNSIRVSWSTPPPESKVLVRGYELGWGKGIPDEDKVEVGPDQHVFNIDSLHPASEYVITVRSFNNRGRGPPRYQTAITREETLEEPITPMMPPVGLKTVVLSSSTVVLTWTDTSLGASQQIQDNRFYTIRYRMATSTDSGRYRHLNSTELNAHIDNLKPNTRYEFEVKVIKGRRQSGWSMKEINKTDETAPGSMPRDLTPIQVAGEPMAVTLNWQPPAKPNGQITGYLVFYTTDSTQDDRNWVVEGVLGDELSAKLKRLTPDTTYYMKVQARNSKGYGPMSETKVYHTPKADGSGGGQVPYLDRVPHNPDGKKYVTPTHDGNKDNYEDKDQSSVGGLSTGIINIIIASVVGATFIIVILVVAVIYCKRRDNGQRNKPPAPANQQSPSKTKNPAGRDLKPPDLWIHTQQMEMRDMDKPERSESMLTMSTMRRSSNDYRSLDDLPPYNPDMTPDMYYHPPSESEERERFLPQRHPGPGLIRPKPTKMMIPVDTQPPHREPIAMVTALPNGGLSQNLERSDSHNVLPQSRPGFPRTQYTTAPRVNAGDIPQPTPNKIPAFDDDDRSSIHSCHDDRSFSSRSIGYGVKACDCTTVTPVHPQPMAVVSPDHQMTSPDGHKSLPHGIHPLRSFSVPSPPPPHQGAPLSTTRHAPKHQIVKPQQSPYKKPTPPISSVPIKPRAMQIISAPKAPDVVLKGGKEIDPDIQKSVSTEELTAEMANLDCLMKDLNAITQQNFEC